MKKEKQPNPSAAQPPTRYDAFIQRCKNNKWIVLLLIGFVTIVGLGSLTDAWTKVRSLFIAGVQQPRTEQVNEEWLPPQLPPSCTNIYLLFAGQSTEMTIEEIKTAHFALINGFEPVKWRVVSNRLYVDVDIPIVSQVINLRGGQFSGNLPPQWEMNFNSNALEIVSASNSPIYQVFYRRPDQVVVNGIFGRRGITLAATTNGLEYWTGESNAAYNLEAFYSGKQTTGLKPIFKYPAWQHKGEYANQ